MRIAQIQRMNMTTQSPLLAMTRYVFFPKPHAVCFGTHHKAHTSIRCRQDQDDFDESADEDEYDDYDDEDDEIDS